MPAPGVVSKPAAESAREASKLPKFDGTSWTLPARNKHCTMVVGQRPDHGESLKEKMGVRESESGQASRVGSATDAVLPS